MPATIWAELGQHKLSYVCTQGIERWEHCRAIAAHLRWEAQVENAVQAVLVGLAVPAAW